MEIDYFGDDLIVEPYNKFISCRFKSKQEKHGWEFDYYRASNKTLQENNYSEEWEPVFLDAAQNVIITELCYKGSINIMEDKDKYVRSNGYKSLEEFLSKLRKTGLVFIEMGYLKLLTDECQCAVTPNGEFVAGENRNGRMSNWIMQKIKDNRKVSF